MVREELDAAKISYPDSDAASAETSIESAVVADGKKFSCSYCMSIQTTSSSIYQTSDLNQDMFAFEHGGHVLKQNQFYEDGNFVPAA